MQMLDKFRKLDSDLQTLILIPTIYLMCIAIVVPLVIIFVPETNASTLPKTEFTTHRKIDNELGVVCYTTVMLKQGEISELDTSCVALPLVCDYSERKVSKISE